jgi:hypothetical protein
MVEETPLTDEELSELEQELRAISLWALDEADVRMLQLRRRAFAELRRLREAEREPRGGAEGNGRS